MSSKGVDWEYCDPNGISVPNGCFFGLPYSLEEAEVVFLPVPWDVTTSYGEGAAQGPQAILEASVQLDWYDFDVPKAWKIPLGTLGIDGEILAENGRMRAIAKQIIEHLEAGGKSDDPAIAPSLAQVNQASADLNDWVYTQSQNYLEQGKLVAVVGGDHSAPLGLMQALGQQYQDYGILQIDAHADLRQAYEGFIYSHASIMDNALKIPQVSRLVQVGIRDVCEAEMERVGGDRRIVAFDDWQLKANAYQGIPWATQCRKIISHLPDRVYISFDIDGLNPTYCPHTGTPVPGGLEFNEAIYLMRSLVQAGKTIIGFDVCEVAPGDTGDQWDGNVGARILYKLACLSQFRKTERSAHPQWRTVD
ncbi:agmatinase family protein [Roseofilum capinflatum]|uniref:Agmatinase family protein n=1 Tax=Roseofilum capinflatum BLCC-M114 TaxID=3022440 RepID=A0ABT7B1I1_9CYAN|nr:agmatinase family protein [Roseofilum capinflatum]MDJ1173023.1 agmatinase family protein [Roseofilum capinflatum BLCC-M114]